MSNNNTLPRFTLPRTQRLKSRKTIETLFSKGNSILAYPLRFAWFVQPLQQTETLKDSIQNLPPTLPCSHQTTAHAPFTSPLQFGVSVSKRYFKRANVRNLLKRRMREAYRLQKQVLYDTISNKQQCLSIMCIYVAKQELSYQDIAPKMKILIDKLNNMIKSNKNPLAEKN